MASPIDEAALDEPNAIPEQLVFEYAATRP
jgi:hypothetical protein